MDSQGMAMFRMNGDRIFEVSVADPSRKLKRILLTVPGIYNVQVKSCFSINNTEENTTLLLVDLPQGVYAGKSQTIEM